MRATKWEPPPATTLTTFLMGRILEISLLLSSSSLPSTRTSEIDASSVVAPPFGADDEDEDEDDEDDEEDAACATSSFEESALAFIVTLFLAVLGACCWLVVVDASEGMKEERKMKMKGGEFCLLFFVLPVSSLPSSARQDNATQGWRPGTRRGTH